MLTVTTTSTTHRPVRRYRIALASAGLVLAMVVSACSSSGGAQSGSASPSAGSSGSQESASSSGGAEQSSGAAEAGKGSAAESWDSVVAAAKKEGNLTLYTSVSTDPTEDLAKNFEEKYGIKVAYVRTNSAALTQRTVEEFESGVNNVDVVIDSVQEDVEQMYTKGITTCFDTIPNWSTWPKDATDPDQCLAIVGYSLYPIVWNTDLITKKSLTWADFLDPKLAGKIGWGDPSNSLNYTWAMMVAKESSGKDDYIKTLAQHELRLFPTSSAATQGVASGEVALSIGSMAVVKELADKGAPIKYVAPDTSTGPARAMSIAAKAAHPNAALLFANFVMDHDTQEWFNVPYGTISPIKGLPGGVDLPSDYRPLDQDTVTEQRPAIVKMLQGK